jgi:hypothetical protein
MTGGDSAGQLSEENTAKLVARDDILKNLLNVTVRDHGNSKIVSKHHFHDALLEEEDIEEDDRKAAKNDSTRTKQESARSPMDRKSPRKHTESANGKGVFLGRMGAATPKASDTLPPTKKNSSSGCPPRILPPAAAKKSQVVRGAPEASPCGSSFASRNSGADSTSDPEASCGGTKRLRTKRKLEMENVGPNSSSPPSKKRAKDIQKKSTPIREVSDKKKRKLHLSIYSDEETLSPPSIRTKRSVEGASIMEEKIVIRAGSRKKLVVPILDESKQSPKRKTKKKSSLFAKRLLPKGLRGDLSRKKKH